MPSHYNNGGPAGVVAVMDSDTVEVSSRLSMSMSQLSVSGEDKPTSPRMAKLQRLTMEGLQALVEKYSSTMESRSLELMDELQRKEVLDRRHRALAHMHSVLAVARGMDAADPFGIGQGHSEPLHGRTELDLCLIADMMTQYSDVAKAAVGKVNDMYSFTGQSAVTWMLASLPGLVDTRKGGEQLGQQMMDAGIIKLASQEAGYFVDSPDVFFTFAEQTPRVPLNCSSRWPAELLPRRPQRVVTDLLLTLTELLNATVGDGEIPTPRLLADVRKTRVWRDYKTDVCELQDVDLAMLVTENDKLAFFLNLYNLMVLHAVVVMGPPIDSVGRLAFYRRAAFKVGGLVFTAMEVEHAILRASSSDPQMGFAGKLLLTIPRFDRNDPRWNLRITRPVPAVSFALFYACKMGPQLPPPFRPDTVERQLLRCAQQYLATQVGCRITMDSERQSKILRLCVPELLEWYYRDFGRADTARAKWIVGHLPPETPDRAQFVAYANANRVRILSKDFDWSPLYSVMPVERSFALPEQ